MPRSCTSKIGSHVHLMACDSSWQCNSVCPLVDFYHEYAKYEHTREKKTLNFDDCVYDAYKMCASVNSALNCANAEKKRSFFCIQHFWNKNLKLVAIRLCFVVVWGSFCKMLKPSDIIDWFGLLNLSPTDSGHQKSKLIQIHNWQWFDL